MVASWLYEAGNKRLTAFYKDAGVTENGNTITQSTDCEKPYKGFTGWKLQDATRNIDSESNDFVLTRGKFPSVIVYREMLVGNLDFLVFKKTYPWDHLPGIAMLSHGKLIISRWNGEPSRLQDIKEGIVIARNEDVKNTILKEIIPSLLLSSGQIPPSSSST